MHTSNPAFARHIPGIEVPKDLADLYALHNEMFGGVKMMADEAHDAKSGDGQPDSAQQGESGKPDDFKSEHSKQSVLADLAKERDERQKLQAEVDKLKPLADQFAKIAAAFGGDESKDGEDATADQLAAIQKRLDDADRAALVERIARQHNLTDDADVAILATIGEASAMEAVAKRLRDASAQPENARRIPRPDRSLGHGEGDKKSSGSVASGRDLYKAAHPTK